MRTALLLILTSIALGACGLRGDLVRPMPLWGDPPLDGPTDPRVIKAAEDAAQAEKERAAEERRAAEEAERQRLEEAATPPQ